MVQFFKTKVILTIETQSCLPIHIILIIKLLDVIFSVLIRLLLVEKILMHALFNNFENPCGPNEVTTLNG